MVGFEAIAHHNGWSMAIAGAAIVLSGLAILSFIISQLHKIVDLIEKRDRKDQGVTIESAITPFPEPTVEVPDRCPADLNETAKLYHPLALKLGDSFQLSELYALAVQAQFPHPHITLRCLRDAGILVALGDGEFRMAG